MFIIVLLMTSLLPLTDISCMKQKLLESSTSSKNMCEVSHDTGDLEHRIDTCIDAFEKMEKQTNNKRDILSTYKDNSTINIHELKLKLNDHVDNLHNNIKQLESETSKLKEEKSTLIEQLKNSEEFTKKLYQLLKNYDINPLDNSSLLTLLGGSMLAGLVFFHHFSHHPHFYLQPLTNRFAKGCKYGLAAGGSVALANISRKMINTARWKYISKKALVKPENLQNTDNIPYYLEQEKVMNQGKTLAFFGSGLIFNALIPSKEVMYVGPGVENLIGFLGRLSIFTGTAVLSNKVVNYAWNQIKNHFYVDKKTEIAPMSGYR